MLGDVAAGDFLNLEQALAANGRLDGHFVQGHVDTVGTVSQINSRDGSTDYTVRYPADDEALVIGRGSICINGISLTVARNDPAAHTLTVSIIPHTTMKTNIGRLQTGDRVNLEFDMLGKYVLKLTSLGMLPSDHSGS